MMANQTIKCSVESCKYNNDNRMCTLEDIEVGAMKSHACEKQDTECNSFEAE